jgi:hypothetical protein
VGGEDAYLVAVAALGPRRVALGVAAEDDHLVAGGGVAAGDFGDVALDPALVARIARGGDEDPHEAQLSPGDLRCRG